MRLHVFQGGFIDGVERNLRLLEEVVEAECTRPGEWVCPPAVHGNYDADLEAQGATAAAVASCVQATFVTQRGVDKSVQAGREEKSGPPDLIAFPELFTCGYVIGKELPGVAEPRDGPSFKRVSAVARRFRVGVVYGYCEKDGSGRCYNSVQLLDKEGKSLANYRKTHLYSDYEKQWFTPGDRFEAPVLFMGLRIGLLICFDIEFPEPIRALAVQGVDLVIVATANTCPIQNIITVPSRSLENLCFVAYVNRTGIEPCPQLGKALAFSGVSVVSGPDGLVLAQASSRTEIIRCRIDPTLERYTRARTVTPYLVDRRPTIYSKL